MKTLFSMFFVFAVLVLPAQESLDNSWLTGTWQGEGFGGVMEEVWSAPDASGTMMGMFRHFDGDGNINFYEFWVLDSAGMKLKHFNPDMVGWEEKEGYVTFAKEDYQDGQVLLKGLTYEKISDDQMKISLKMKNGEEVKTEIFMMTKMDD
ncbi:MAG: hypothetical protein JXR10_03000 [Cyclobacteriaceae bacterium]